MTMFGVTSVEFPQISDRISPHTFVKENWRRTKITKEGGRNLRVVGHEGYHHLFSISNNFGYEELCFLGK